MSNLFQEVLQNARGVQERLLGPSYPYYKNVRMPSDIGMTSQGSMRAIGNNINGLINYVELLVSGNSRASTTGRPLGNRFFLRTAAKCVDVDTSNNVDRYIYVDNVPSGNIPFISSGLGVNFSEFRGLIPGTMSNLNVLNPFNLMQSFLSGSTPPCQRLTMQTIDVNNNRSSETHFVTLTDIRNMDPCIFPNRINPVTNARCRESFETNMNTNPAELKLPEDPIAQLYFASLGGLGIYILYKIMEKS